MYGIFQIQGRTETVRHVEKRAREHSLFRELSKDDLCSLAARGAGTSMVSNKSDVFFYQDYMT